MLHYYKRKLNKPINLVFDVGANVGQSIDLFLKLDPECKIISFEPNPRLYKQLLSKYSDNLNIEIYNL